MTCERIYDSVRTSNNQKGVINGNYHHADH
nr:MAG TPA: Protein of unknown function (DUF2514) [Caudoviricetes sp.]